METYKVIARAEFIGESLWLWNVTDKKKMEYIKLFRYGFHKDQLVKRSEFEIHDGIAYHLGAIKKNLHIPRKPIIKNK